MKKYAVMMLLGGMLSGTAAVAAEHHVHWGYAGNEGPEFWGSLSSKFALCDSGKNQSPIDLTGFTEAELAPLEFSYTTEAANLVNNGHSIQANYQPGSSLTVDGHTFELKQFHFHVPSENHIDGQSYPMEAHLVHADKDGNLAVVAVMFEQGEANPVVDALWQQLPLHAGDEAELAGKVNVEAMLPESRDYYRFNGSLTTPPCSEGVWWLVMKQPVSVSQAQIDKFAEAIPHPNNRPVQPVNARTVLK